LAEIKATNGEKAAESMQTLFYVARACDQIMNAIRATISAHGLSPAQFRLLMALTYQFPNGVPTIEAANQLGVRPPTLSQLLDSSSELVRRQRRAPDRRIIWLTITEQGSAALSKVLPSIGALARTLATDVGAQREELISLLNVAASAVAPQPTETAT
ncbi:MAG: MarR family winged helix-turn-helix transcriptional regulator, partial [Acidimicrobiales bacterium]